MYFQQSFPFSPPISEKKQNTKASCIYASELQLAYKCATLPFLLFCLQITQHLSISVSYLNSIWHQCSLHNIICNCTIPMYLHINCYTACVSFKTVIQMMLCKISLLLFFVFFFLYITITKLNFLLLVGASSGLHSKITVSCDILHSLF